MTRSRVVSAAGALAATLIASLSVPGAALAAGQIQVKWIEPEKFSDVGRSAFDRERTLESLAEHIRSLGKKLPDGQALSLEVTDVELAGEIEPFGRFHDDVRVMRGRADWPRISFRYTLSEGDRTLASGKVDLSEPHYFFRSLGSQRAGALAYEKRMLDEWVTSLLAPVAKR